MPILSYLTSTFLGALGISMLTMTQLIFPGLPNQPSHEIKSGPRLGGIAIFISFIFASSIGLYNLGLAELTYIISATMLIFFIGLKDEILVLPSFKKIIAKLVVAGILIFPAKIRITNIHGMFGIEAIGIMLGALISCILIISILDTFSLIDNTSKPASIPGFYATLVLGSWFAFKGHTDYAILSFSLIGSIAGFSLYNHYYTQNRIAMGKMGAQFLGLVISVLIIRFNELADFTIPASKIFSSLLLLFILGCILLLIYTEFNRRKHLISILTSNSRVSFIPPPENIVKKRRKHRRKRDKEHYLN